MTRGLLLLCLVGCMSRDDVVDDPPIGGPVTVRVMRGDDPIANATVIFSDTTNRTFQTDADGRITADIEANGIVTAIDPDDTSRLVSLTRMHAMDFVELPLDVPAVPKLKPTVATLTIEAPTSAAPPGTDRVAIETPCGVFEAQTFPASFPISSDCFADGGVPIIMTAAEPLGSLEDPGHGLAFVAGIASGTNPTFKPGAWSTSCAHVETQIADRMQITFYSRLGGRTFRSFPDFCASQAGAIQAYDFGEGAVTTSYGQIEGLRYHTLVKNFDKLPARVEVGASPALLAGDLRLLAMDDRGAEWTRDAALRDADVAIAELTWILPQQKSLTWKLVLPGDATGIVLPRLAQTATLASATSRTAELRYFDASWIQRPDVPSLAFLDDHMPEMPFGASVRGFSEQFFPDAR